MGYDCNAIYNLQVLQIVFRYNAREFIPANLSHLCAEILSLFILQVIQSYIIFSATFFSYLYVYPLSLLTRPSTY